jgi:hypothetical protein
MIIFILRFPLNIDIRQSVVQTHDIGRTGQPTFLLLTRIPGAVTTNNQIAHEASSPRTTFEQFGCMCLLQVRKNIMSGFGWQNDSAFGNICGMQK